MSDEFNIVPTMTDFDTVDANSVPIGRVASHAPTMIQIYVEYFSSQSFE